MKKNKIPYIIYFTLLVIVALVIYLVPSITGMLEQTYLAEYGNLKIEDETYVCLVRDETVYLADKSGEINPLMDEGELLKQGTGVIEIKGTGLTEPNKKYAKILERLGGCNSGTVNKTAGVVTYHVDGYENSLTPETIDDINKKQFDSLLKTDVLQTSSGDVYIGDPVFKIIDNGGWYMVYYVTKEEAERYEVGEDITVFFSSDDVDCKVYGLTEEGNYYKVILSCNRYYEKYPYSRVEKVTVLISNEQGIILENESIFELDGQTGVYLKNKLDENVFKPVKIIAKDSEKTVVHSNYFNGSDGMPVETIEPYDEVVRTPEVEEE